METLLWLIQSYGYAFIFVATALEGETILALAGFTAYQGYLDLKTVIAIAMLGAVLGDQAFFYFGRYKGKKFLQRHPKLLARSRSIHRLIERHQNLLIFGSRFMYGFRTIIPIAIGTSNVSEAKFLLLNVLGASVWSVFFGLGGYAFGNALERLIGHIHRAEKFVILGVLAGALIVQAISFLYRRIQAKIEAEERREEKLSGMDNSDNNPI